MSEALAQLRLYLNDPDGEVFEDDPPLQRLLDNNDGDLDGAAADGWKIKLATFTEWYDVMVDRSDEFSRSQVFRQCERMYRLFSEASGKQIESIRMSTDDTIDTDQAAEWAV
jgi:hypothetical protein